MIFGPDGVRSAREWLELAERGNAPQQRRQNASRSRRFTRSYGAASSGAGFMASVPVALRGFWYRELVSLGTPPNIATLTNKWLGTAWSDAITPTVNEPDEIVSANFTRGGAWGFTPNEYFELFPALSVQRLFHFPGATGYALGLTFRTIVDGSTTNALCGSYAESAATNGFNVRHITSTDLIQVRVGNGSGTHMVDVSTAGGSAPHNTNHSLVLALRDHATESDFQLILNNGAPVSGTFVGAPNNADSGSACRIGARGGAVSWYHTGEISEAVLILDYTYAGALAAYLDTQVV